MRRRLSVAIRRGRRRCDDRKAQWLARWVQGASETRLESAMRGPFRTVLLWQVVATMCRRCDAGREPGLDAIIEFGIRRPRSRTVDRYRIAVANGRCTRARRGERAPTVVLDSDSVSFLRLVAGAAAPARLVLGGRLKIRGDVLLAARLPKVLNIPSPTDRRRPRRADRRRARRFSSARRPRP